ncbi:hypothetical protein [Chryseobacterium sp. KCF3-3]|uniref:hypothetical protein n=1 Tax=Chryseobacterium sp. KCF3-3 TaxID=3231511 RepID=UPI0038B2FEC9
MVPHSSLKKKKMGNGIILHLENDKTLIERYNNLYQQLDMEFEYIGCSTTEEFNSVINDQERNIKAIIFDLIGSKATKEELAGNPEFLTVINEKFVKYNLPIFIYSGHLESIDDKYTRNGTVFKVSKDDSIQDIFDKIKFLSNSGFIDVFCPGGVLESEIKAELNKSFTNQFSQNNQIEEVLKSIMVSEKPENQKERVKKVFKRIAIKTLSSDLLAPVADSEDKVHPIEHFYKRQSKLPVWTGDIWKQKNGEETFLILTPRCDFATRKAANVMVAKIHKPKPIKLNGKPEEVEKRLRDYLTDNLQGKSTRYIPSNIFFSDGGMIDLADHHTIDLKSFTDNFDYIITLSDDLTNEIIGKFAYYFLRTGITNINEQEFEAIIKAVNSENKDVEK